MAGRTLAGQLLEGAREWAGRLPAALARELTVDVAARRVRVGHPRVEALVRRLLADVPSLGLRGFEALPHAYDVRLVVHGWRLRVEVALERVELATGGYTVWLRTPGRVELEASGAASLLVQGVLGVRAGRSALAALAARLLPPGLAWDGEVLRVRGLLPREGAVPARLFETSALTLAAEHTPEGLWLQAEAWPGVMELLQAALSADLPRVQTPPGR
jgi:hypothetical protein